MKTYSQEFLNEKSDNMMAFLKRPIPQPSQDKYEDLIINHMMLLGKMLGESSDYLAFSKYRVDEILHGEIATAIDRAFSEKLSTSTINMYVKSACKDWNYLVNAFDRINSSCGKLIMAIQTLISYEKAKLNYV